MEDRQLYTSFVSSDQPTGTWACVSLVLIWGFPRHCFVISRAFSPLKWHTQAYGGSYTGIVVENHIPCPWLTRRPMPSNHGVPEGTTTDASFFHVFISFILLCAQQKLTLPNVTGSSWRTHHNWACAQVSRESKQLDNTYAFLRSS